MSRTLAAQDPHVRIGHNGGPPLDVGYHAWVWRRAHAQAWKNPGREIVMLRLRQAERLGLDYRTYTSALMDRGMRLEGLLLMAGPGIFAIEEIVAAKLTRLSECPVILCVPAHWARESFGSLVSLARMFIVRPDTRDAPLLGSVLKEGLRAHALVPASLFMVGTGKAQRLAAECAGLGAFVDARDYFGVEPPGNGDGI